jgi:hypothetical protein
MVVSRRCALDHKTDLSGDSEPAIHLAYGLQLSSRTMAIESLAMACCSPSNDKLEKAEKDGKISSRIFTPIEILEKMAHEDVKKDINDDILLDHWRALDLTNNLQKRFEEMQSIAVKLAVGRGDSSVLRSFHAIRTLLPLIPDRFHILLIRHWWMSALTEFVSQQQHLSHIRDMDDGQTWKKIEQLARSHQLNDACCLGNLVSLKYARETWSDGTEDFYLAAASILVNQPVPGIAGGN